jgi:hypothetical protein
MNMYPVFSILGGEELMDILFTGVNDMEVSLKKDSREVTPSLLDDLEKSIRQAWLQYNVDGKYEMERNNLLTNAANNVIPDRIIAYSRTFFGSD